MRLALSFPISAKPGFLRITSSATLSHLLPILSVVPQLLPTTSHDRSSPTVELVYLLPVCMPLMFFIATGLHIFPDEVVAD